MGPFICRGVNTIPSAPSYPPEPPRGHGSPTCGIYPCVYRRLCFSPGVTRGLLMEPLGGTMERVSLSEVPTGLALPRATPCVRVQGRRCRGHGASVASPDVHVAANPPGLFFPVTLAGQPGGRTTHLKPRLPEHVAQRQLVGDLL